MKNYSSKNYICKTLFIIMKHNLLIKSYNYTLRYIYGLILTHSESLPQMWDGNARVTNWAGVMKMNFWVNLIQEHWASTSPINLVLHFMGNVQGGSIIHRVPLKNINLTKCRLINLFPNVGICAHCGICIACQKVRWSSKIVIVAFV